MFEVRFRREALGSSLGRLKGRMFAYNFDFTAGMTKYNRSLAIFYLGRFTYALQLRRRVKRLPTTL